MTNAELWQRFLSDTPAGAAPSQDLSFICDLSACAVSSATGADAETFLHGQLSSDVKGLPAGRAQLAAFNTPKGRMLAIMLLWRTESGFLLQMPASIAPAMLKRLSMFVLRSKVRMADASNELIRFGVGGPDAAAALGELGIATPPKDFDVAASANVAEGETRLVLRLPGERFELLYSDAGAARTHWTALAARLPVATDAPWRWLGVRAGIPDIEPATQDKYVPQMLNLELVGGISFTKGCYPGQEIVARTQYRGEIKRRMRLAHVDSVQSPVPGQDIVAAGDQSQAVGSVASVAPAPGGGFDLLACLHLDLAHNADLRLGVPDGPALELLSLPYPLPQVA